MRDHTLASRRALARFVLYVLVGAAGTAGHYAVLFTTVGLGMLDPVRATVLGALTGAVINFVMNAMITFRAQGRSHLVWSTAARFFATAALAVAANGLLMTALLAMFDLDYRLAQLLVTAALLCATFGIYSAWTYRATTPR
jgi:putative flippase GtrA